METLLDLSVSIASQPAILVPLVALLGLVLQKKKFSDVAQGTLKTFVGFLVLIGGAGLLVNSLTPFVEMFQTALNTQGVAPSNKIAVAIVLQQYGAPTALIMLVGMVANILLTRFTRFKYIFSTGRAMMYISCLAAVILVGTGFSVSLPMILLGGLFEGTLLTVTPVLCQPFMKQTTGNDKVAMGHTGNIGYAASSSIGKIFENKEKSTEDIKILRNFGFLKDLTISAMILISIIYVILALLAGTSYVEHKLSNGENAIILLLIQAGTLTAGSVVVLQDMRMILGEIVPAFQGIVKKLVSNSKPALDVPIIFPYAPNAVLIGLFVSLIVGAISMLAMVGLNTTVIISGVVGHFFCDAAAGAFGNSTGGRREAILGAAFNGLLISWLPPFILLVLGDLQLAFSTFADTDCLTPGLFLGRLGKTGPSLLVGGVTAFVVVVLLASAVLTMREKRVAEEN